MAIVTSNAFPPSIRTLACAALSGLLNTSRVLDWPWPAAGAAVRRFILFMWWSAGRALGESLRNRLRGEVAPAWRSLPVRDNRPDIAPESIRLTVSETPVVSVIIPTYGQVGFTLRCLASI